MPNLSGMELIAQLRDRHIATPAILLASQATVSLSTRAALANIPIVEKPLLGSALVDRIREACRLASR
jgi:FixJ family two-component response regulator